MYIRKKKGIETMNIKKELDDDFSKDFQFNDINVDPLTIKTIMINEVVPSDPYQDFYGQPDADYMKTTIPLFQKAGYNVSSIEDILKLGIYMTNAVKTPKTEYTITRDTIEQNIPYLEKEIALFPNVKVIMLMGDVSKKAFNMITKKATKKNVIPAISTYKLRSTKFYYNDIRIIPSYIMTGGNILIEKSKFQMVSEDIRTMMEIIH